MFEVTFVSGFPQSVWELLTLHTHPDPYHIKVMVPERAGDKIFDLTINRPHRRLEEQPTLPWKGAITDGARLCLVRGRIEQGGDEPKVLIDVW
jgi:hypothetical protein